MNRTRPIFTVVTECQDCYKCVRRCPVKAIRVQDGHASVEPERCVYCGACVDVCPNNAKRVRDDLPALRRLIDRGVPVYASLAPSCVAEFPDLTLAQLRTGLRALGFAGVSETAVGAEVVSREAESWLAAPGTSLAVSSACPVIVDIISKYYPEVEPCLTSAPSPLIAHAAMLRDRYGEQCAVAFVGPCIAKKCEADAPGSPVDIAITFHDLRRWFTAVGVDPRALSTDDDGDALGHVPGSTGCLYPVDGGMIARLDVDDATRLTRCMSASGLRAVHSVLEGLDPAPTGRSRFLELLACDGGCINGPGTSKNESLVARRTAVASFAVSRERSGPVERTQLPPRWQPERIPEQVYADDEIGDALLRVGKRSPADELNCGGCGYDSCHAFAVALIAGRAETSMCVTYMRRLAQKKNNALLKTMPSAAVTVDSNLRIVESNLNFARLCGDDAELAYEALPGLEGARLDRFLPEVDLFTAVLNNGGEILDRAIRVRDAIVRASVFSIEEHHLVGAILLDITDPAMQKQQIVEKSREVIAKNLETVQQIAYLLGENASETELILNSIVRSYSSEVPT